MEFIKSMLKGVVIGVANIIPGVSGGTMMVAMGIYDKLIHCITHFFKEFKENIKFLLPIGIGLVLGLVGLSFLIEPAFEHFPLPTNALFIGLIVGGLPAIFKKVKGNKFKFGYIFPLLIFFVVVVGMAAMGEKEGVAADLTFTLWNVIKLFLVGVIASATMVIPGVSGSMMLLLLGYYNPIIETINAFIKALMKFDVPVLLETCGVLVPMGIGIVVGVIGIAKLVELIFNKCPMYAYWGIIGLIVASPFAILLVAELGTITVLSVVISIITFAAGFFVAMKLGD
ncbi:MAG: DUF368 domain-containing protein [Lachnospiraceae bacterium]|nr:DUF368 domain-containing protein [Lachnospiraceae bacterium]